MAAEVKVFGIRHHGPGSARSLVAALEALGPDCVLVEGPPDAQEVLELVTSAQMRPPVALLVYPTDAPSRAVYYPFAVFSPEWQALAFAFGRGIPARFIDLPQSLRFAAEDEQGERAEDEPGEGGGDGEGGERDEGEDSEQPLREDPLGLLAEAAGYRERELWWEQQVEQRRDPTGIFDALLEAMGAMREGAAEMPLEEQRREAHMRKMIRGAMKEGFARIAVICGAWHAPALAEMPTAKHDNELLRGLKRTKVTATWIPWTYSRLSYRSGYGAGVVCPGWYEHLWNDREQAGRHWVIRAARLLRGEDLEAPSASVIEAVRLGEALAAVREVAQPGLAEWNDAIQSVLCHGDTLPMRLIHRQLEVGDALGGVPQAAPTVPLAKDLQALQKRLRLKVSQTAKQIELDLRKESGLERSRLLHRLNLLGIPWGKPQDVSAGSLGTFKEAWSLQWQVEFAVAVIEANVWGNTVAGAADAKARHLGERAENLAQLSELLDAVILADLDEAVRHLLERIQEQAAVAADVRHLMDALPPLARVARYGDVRGTPRERVVPIIRGLFERTLVGLPAACASLDDEAAERMVGHVGRVQTSLGVLGEDLETERWYAVLERLAEEERVHALVRGSCCRVLLDQQRLDSEGLERLAGLALSPAVEAGQAAAWIEGLVRGSGLLLLHQEGLWRALDAWLCRLHPETFTELVPLLRRAFSGFSPAERRQMGDRVRHLGRAAEGKRAAGGGAGEMELDEARARRVLPVLAKILGVSHGE